MIPGASFRKAVYFCAGSCYYLCINSKLNTILRIPKAINHALTQSNDHQAALAILNATGVPVLEAAILAKEALSANWGSIRRARRRLAARFHLSTQEFSQ